MNIYYNENYLAHYGIKGMKWGVRHDPEIVGRKNGPGRGRSAKYKRNRGFSKAAKFLFGAAAVTGVAAIGIYAANKHMVNGRLVADNVIKAGTTLRHVTEHPESIENGKRIYAAANKIDAVKYRALFGGGTPMANNLKKAAETTVKKDIRVAGLKTGENVFNKLYKTDAKFAKDVDDMYDAYKYQLPNARGKWEVFNTLAPLKDPKAPNVNRPGYDTFEKALREKGYHGFADVNDRKNSGFNTNAHILFDYKDRIGEVNVKQLTQSDINKARRHLQRHETMTQYVTAENAAYVSAGSAFVGTMVELDSRSYSNNKKKRRKKYNVKTKN